MDYSPTAKEEAEDSCPVGVGGAAVHEDGTACWDESKLVIPYELEVEDLNLPACETG